MAVNYTEKDVELIVSAYKENPSRETVEVLAEQLNKRAYIRRRYTEQKQENYLSQKLS